MFHPIYRFLLDNIKQHVSIDENLFLGSQSHQPNTSIILNPDKIQDVKHLDFEVSEKVLWANNAYYLNTRPAFYIDPLFYTGAYYVMDASSMFLEYILYKLNISKNAAVLDIAAAPGSKSIIISNYLNESGLLWSNEINFNRSKILHYNLSKWGKSNFVVTNNHSWNFSKLNGIFDVAVCDVPCSGSGLFRKYPEWINSFNENLVQNCVHRQKEILNNVFSSIKENGYLIYSTCSFCPEENEHISEYILQNGFEYIDIPIPKNYGILKTSRGIRFFPHLTKSEGFFYAIFQKKENKNTTSLLKHLYIKNILPTAQPIFQYIHPKEYHMIYEWRDKYYLSNRKINEYLYSSFNYISLGMPISSLKKIHIPAPELALSIHLSDNISKINLSATEALQYLKKEKLKISAGKDIYLVKYKNLGLGWIKVLENRINNYYPAEWRIIKDIEIIE